MRLEPTLYFIRTKVALGQKIKFIALIPPLFHFLAVCRLMSEKCQNVAVYTF